jgi:hypothetical protein
VNLNLYYAYAARYLNNPDKSYDLFLSILNDLDAKNIPSYLGIIDISFERNHFHVTKDYVKRM